MGSGRFGYASIWGLAFLILGTAAYGTEVPFGAEQQINSSEFTLMRSIVFADIDNDGDQDVVANAQGTGVVLWFENTNGDASAWTEHTIDGDFGETAFLRVGDLNGDGNPDVVASKLSIGVVPNEESVVWYENSGNPAADATWASSPIVTNLALPIGVAIEDIDVDGDQDVVVAHTSLQVPNPDPGDEILWFENIPVGGGALAWQVHTVATGIGDPFEVSVADFNRDGFPDIVTAASKLTTGTDLIAWFANDGDPRNSSSWAIENIDTAFGGARGVSTADIDRDGRIDVVAAAQDDNEVAWYRNTGTSTWTKMTIDPAFSNATALTVADIDKDGDFDVAAGGRDQDNPGTDSVSWWENTDGAGGAWTEYALFSGDFDRTGGMWAGDLDGDGDVDLGVTELGAGDALWLPNNTIHRNAIFPALETIVSDIGGVTNVAAGDFDGDGDTDVAAPTAVAAWMRNDGGGTWTKQHTGTFATGDASVAAGDIDRDGIADYITAVGGTIRWASGTATGAMLSVSGNIGATAIAIADIDRDGYQDVVSVGAGRVLWHENANNIGTSWTRHSIEESLSGSRAVTIGDVNSDGALDVIAVSESTGAVRWWANDGSPGDDSGGDGNSWTERTVDTSFTGGLSVATGDVDGDGDTDLVGASASQNAVVWWRNNDGSGTSWTRVTITASLSGARSIVVGDLDCDGDADVMAAGFEADSVVLFANANSLGTSWEEIPANGSLGGAAGLALADIDDDGDLDSLAAGAEAGALVALENRGGQFQLDSTPADGGDTANSATVVGLEIEARHAGRSGDGAIELKTFELRFEEFLGTTLTSGEANALVQELRVYRDDGDDSFNAGSDILVATNATLSLSGGVHTESFADGDANIALAPGAPRLYFVVLDITADADAQSPNNLRVVHISEGSSTAVDLDNDIPMTLAATPNGASDLFTFGATFPTVTVSSGTGNPTNANPIPVSVVFSEDVVDFIADDVTVTNGSVSNFSGSGANYSFDLVPAGEGTVSAFVAASVAASTSGGANQQSNMLMRTFDSTAPSGSLSSAAANLVNSPITVSVALSESVTGFDATDIATVNANASNFSGSGATYSFTLTPMSEGLFSASIASAQFVDAAGNANQAIATISRTFDITGPTITLDSDAEQDVGEPFTVTAALSESTADFQAGDVTVVNGSVSDFSFDTPTSVSFVVTADGAGAVSVQVEAGSFTDTAGNPNAASNVLERNALRDEDINGDGVVNAVDVQLVINAALGLNVGEFADRTDVNGDATANAVDVQLVINAALGVS